jgi:hypothetical protein
MPNVPPHASRRKSAATTPAYLAKLVTIALSLPRGSVHHVDIYHDDWCALLTHDGVCDCSPDVRLRQRAS